MLIGEQANGRRERRIASRIREAGFAETKTLADFDWQFNAAVIDRVRIEALAAGIFRPASKPCLGGSKRRRQEPPNPGDWSLCLCVGLSGTVRD